MTETAALNWRSLFVSNPTKVTVACTSDGRTLGSDRYSIWDLSRVCETHSVPVPEPGQYRAMARELRRTGPATDIPGDGLAALLDGYATGIEPDPTTRLVGSEWATGQHRPLTHVRTGEVRLINIKWDHLPPLGALSCWAAPLDWDRLNVAVRWGTAERCAFGAVQLVGRGTGDYGVSPDLAFALACEVVSYQAASRQYRRGTEAPPMSPPSDTLPEALPRIDHEETLLYETAGAVRALDAASDELRLIATAHHDHPAWAEGVRYAATTLRNTADSYERATS